MEMQVAECTMEGVGTEKRKFTKIDFANNSYLCGKNNKPCLQTKTP